MSISLLFSPLQQQWAKQVAGVSLCVSVCICCCYCCCLYLTLPQYGTPLFFSCFSGPSEVLGRHRPPGSLMTAFVIVSIVGQIVIQVVFQLGALFYTTYQPWFEYNHHRNEIKSYENTIVFLVANFQYLWAAIAFSVSKSYRRPIYTNSIFVLNIVVLLALSAIILFIQRGFLGKVFELEVIPTHNTSYIVGVCGFVFANCIVSYCFQQFVVGSNWFNSIVRVMRRKKKYKNSYKYIAMDVIENLWIQKHIAIHSEPEA
eukprot:m.165477 g.165477  ORF g.165477 m.165477 type:complete len:259 (-) comp13438_c0_seq8:2282-3058(-)